MPYRFKDLDPDVRERVKQRWAENYGYDRRDEALEVIKALAKHFGGEIKDWSIDWFDSSYSSANFYMPEILNESDEKEAEARLEELEGGKELTGWWLDRDAVEGFREEWDSGERDFNALMEAAFRKWLKGAQADCADMYTDETFGDNCDCNEMWFEADGSRADPPAHKGRVVASPAADHSQCGYYGTCVANQIDQSIAPCR